MIKRRSTLSLVALALTFIALWSVFSSPSSQQIANIRQSFTANGTPDKSPDSPKVAIRDKESPHEDQVQAIPAAALSQIPEKTEQNKGDLNELVKGKPIMSKMKNETIRAEVGNAGWKLFHTILAQYPEDPDEEARNTLHNYLLLFSRVYPCRECAEHFQQLLAEYPPQLSSRKVAVMWGCDAHNKVNKRLGKEIFDCAYIDDKYDCGCGDEDEDQDKTKESAVSPVKGG